MLVWCFDIVGAFMIYTKIIWSYNSFESYNRPRFNTKISKEELLQRSYKFIYFNEFCILHQTNIQTELNEDKYFCFYEKDEHETIIQDRIPILSIIDCFIGGTMKENHLIGNILILVI